MTDAHAVTPLWMAVAASLMAALGIEPAPLFWALVGAVLGLSLAAPTTLVRAVPTFIAVVFASSKFGSYLALQFMEGDMVAPSVCACFIASFYHPIYQRIASAMPGLADQAIEIFRGWISRVFGANK